VLRCHRPVAIFKAKSSPVAVCRREPDNRRSGRHVDNVDTIYQIWISSTMKFWELYCRKAKIDLVPYTPPSTAKEMGQVQGLQSTGVRHKSRHETRSLLTVTRQSNARILEQACAANLCTKKRAPPDQ